MLKLKITSPEGNTTEEFFTQVELGDWFSRQERAELELTGRLRQVVGERGFRLIERLPNGRGEGSSQLDGLFYLMVSETSGAEYVQCYSETEMAELFSYEERDALEKGGVVIRGACRYVNMVAAARTVRD